MRPVFQAACLAALICLAQAGASSALAQPSRIYLVTQTTGTLTPATTPVDGLVCDDCTAPVTFPFPVQVYGRTFTSANVSSNGNIQFTTSSEQTVLCPTDDAPFALFPYSADLMTNLTGTGVFTRTVGTAPNRVFEIEWRTVFFASANRSANFLVRFAEDSGVVEFVYGAIAPPSFPRASIGISGDSVSGVINLACRQTITPAAGTVTRFTPVDLASRFTYQGVLDFGSGPANGAFDMQFAVFDAETGGTPRTVGTVPGVVVNDGRFSVPVALPDNVLDGRRLWVEVRVGSTVLSPRQELTPTPYAGMAYAARSLIDAGGEVVVGTRGDGAVGIGTGSPAMSLQVSGPNTYYGAPALGADADLNWAYLHVPASTTNGSAVIWNASGGLRFGGESDRGRGFAEFARFGPTGSFGLGDANPEARLTVGGSVRINSSTNPDDISGLLAFGTIGDRIGGAEGTDLIAFKRVNAANDSSQLRLILGDNFTAGSGVDSFSIGAIPGGMWNERFRFTSDGQAFKVGATAWAALSDARLKHDVQPLEGTLEKMLGLRA